MSENAFVNSLHVKVQVPFLVVILVCVCLCHQHLVLLSLLCRRIVARRSAQRSFLVCCSHVHTSSSHNCKDPDELKRKSAEGLQREQQIKACVSIESATAVKRRRHLHAQIQAIIQTPNHHSK